MQQKNRVLEVKMYELYKVQFKFMYFYRKLLLKLHLLVSKL